MAKESIMGARTAGTASAKRTPPIKKAKKKISNPTPAGGGKAMSLGSRVDRLDEAIVSMAAGIAATSANVKTLIRVHRDTERANKEAFSDIRRTIQELSESLEMTTREMRQTTQGLSESLEMTTREMRQTTQELSESLEKTTQELSDTIHRLDDNVGGINRSLGRVVELVVLPGLMEKMNTQFGYQFDNVSPNKKFTDSGQEYAEIDLFLENGESVMAVEAKTRVREKDMNKFLERLDALRQHETRAGVAGKTIYAAVAGISFDDNARKIAEAKGMYFVDIDQNNDRINIKPPAGMAGKW
jgi:flagellar biosynthesis chaperone FliJ